MVEQTGLPKGTYATAVFPDDLRIVGRIVEERDGAGRLYIEPVYQGRLLPAIVVARSAAVRINRCTAAVASRRAPTDAADLNATIARVVRGSPAA
jgi:hypothetical protein